MKPPPRYVVQRQLRTAGPDVTCYQAIEPGLDRVVELRVLDQGASAERFGWETRMLAGFSHPNLLDVLDSGRLQEQAFYVAPYRESRTLEEVLQEGRRSQLEVARVACALCAALGFLHARGLLHRSLAPADILFEPA